MAGTLRIAHKYTGGFVRCQATPFVAPDKSVLPKEEPMNATPAATAPGSDIAQPEIRVLIISPRNLATMESVIREVEQLGVPRA